MDFKITYLFPTLLLSATLSFSQSIDWQNTIGGDNADELNSSQMTSDGGYILAGTSTSTQSGDKSENEIGSQDFWVVKVDNMGVLEWENTIGGSDQDVLNKVVQTSDGGYLLGGRSRSDISGDKSENAVGSFDYWVVKLNSNGVIDWEKTIGGAGIDRMNDLIQTSDGGYLIAGHSTSGISGDKTEANIGVYNLWIVKLNNSGTIQWDQTIGGDQIDIVGSIMETTSGDYLIGAYSNSGIAGDKTEASNGNLDYWIIQTDNTGAVQWEKSYGGSGNDELKATVELQSGNYLLGGTSVSGINGDKTEASQGNDFWVLEVNTSGVIQWQNTIGGSGAESLSSLSINNGSIFISGTSDSDISGDKTENSFGGNDYWMVKTDLSGNILQDKTYGGTGSDELEQMYYISDNEFVFAGFSNSNINTIKDEDAIGGSDYWIFKTTCLDGEIPVIAANQDFLCIENAGDPIDLTVQSGNLNDADDWVWYENSCGGTAIGTGSTITVNPTATSTYFARSEGGCVTPSDCDDLTITVIDIEPSAIATDLTCYDAMDGAVDLEVTGGDQPYTYDWSNDGHGDQDDNQDLSTVEDGLYKVYITDNNGCVDSLTTTVSAPLPFNVNVSSTDEINGNDGSIDITTTGGTAPYNYSWTGPNSFMSSDEDLMNLEGGTYTTTLTDDNGCDTTFDVVVNSFVSINENKIEVIAAYPNPNNGQFNIQVSSSNLGGILIIRDLSGKMISQKQITNTTTPITLHDVASGVLLLEYNNDQKKITKKIVIR